MPRKSAVTAGRWAESAEGNPSPRARRTRTSPPGSITEGSQELLLHSERLTRCVEPRVITPALAAELLVGAPRFPAVDGEKASRLGLAPKQLGVTVAGAFPEQSDPAAPRTVGGRELSHALRRGHEHPHDVEHAKLRVNLCEPCATASAPAPDDPTSRAPRGSRAAPRRDSGRDRPA